MSVVREMHQPGDIIYTVSNDGQVNAYMIMSDGEPTLVNMVAALRAEYDPPGDQ